MIHQWEKALLENAPDIFERGSSKKETAVDPGKIKNLHAKIGEEGNGFRVVLDGMNAERILIAAECIGDGRYFIDKATAYARDRQVFGRPIGQNQGIQFPLAHSYAEIEAAALLR